MYNTLGQGIFCIELIISIGVLLIHQKKRPHALGYFFSLLLLTTILLLFWRVPWNHPLIFIKYIVLFLSVLCAFYLAIDLPFWHLLYWGINGFIIQHINYSIVLMLSSFHATIGHSFGFLIILYIVSSLIEYHVVTPKSYDFYTLKDNYKMILLMSLLVITITVLLNSTREVYSTHLDPVLTFITPIYSLLSCFLALTLQLNLIERKKILSEREVFKQLWLNDQKQYELSHKNLELLNMYCHDLKHFINASHDQSQFVDFSKKASHSLDLYESKINTGNHAIDVILTEKILYCKENDIELTCMVDGHLLQFIDTIDLYSIFGNLLTNAIEAVLHSSDAKHRVIALVVKDYLNYVKIHVENYYEGSITFTNGLPLSQKQPHTLHGYGLRSVQYLIESYKGHLSIDVSDSIFNVNIIIPIPK